MGLDNYNGYSNRETWVITLWIDNDHDSHVHFQEMAKGFDNPHRFADALREHFEYIDAELFEGMPGMWHDLLGTALARVDWVEVARSIMAQ